MELDKRKPGQSKLDSPRLEKDRVYVFSGVMENQMSTGAPIGIVIPNNDIEDIHVGQYHDYKDMARPGHAEYTFMKKYGQYNDWVGAGRASGRETVSRVAGGAVAKLILDQYGIDVTPPRSFHRAATFGTPVSLTRHFAPLLRSEERRVGKECRSRWSPYH